MARSRVVALAAVLAVALAASCAHAKVDVSKWNLNATVISEVLEKFGSDVHTTNAVALFRSAMGHSGRSLKGTDDSTSSLQTLLASVLGSSWSSYFPSSWLSLDWSSLGDFNLEDNISEFFNSTSIGILGNATIKDAYESAKEAVQSVCGDDEITYPEKIPAYCAGPSISFQYVPKKCDIIESNKTIVCSSPKLISVKTPAVCALGGIEGFSYEGKTCRIKGEIGLEMFFQAGGRPYTLTPSVVHGIFDKLFNDEANDDSDGGDDGDVADGSESDGTLAGASAAPVAAPASAPVGALYVDDNEGEELLMEAGDEEGEEGEEEEEISELSENLAQAPAAK